MKKSNTKTIESERRIKISATLRRRSAAGEIKLANKSMLGKKHSEDTKRKMRESALLRIKNNPNTKPPTNLGRITSKNVGAIRAWAKNNIPLGPVCSLCGYNDTMLCLSARVKKPQRDLNHWATICNSCRTKVSLWSNHVKVKNKKIVDSKKYNKWRKEVLHRLDSRCLWCGSWENVQADHVKPVALFPELIYDVNNGRPLCKDCHKKTITYGGKIHALRNNSTGINWWAS